MLSLALPGRVFVCVTPTDMRKSFDGLSVMVQEVLKEDPFSGHLFAFRGRKADMIKLLYWDGTGLCLFTKRLQRGRFIWPHITTPGGSVVLTPAQLAMLIEGIDWRFPERTWRPAIAG